MEATKLHLIIPVKTKPYYSVHGLIEEGYVRLQAGTNDFYIPANTFRRAAFLQAVGQHVESSPVRIERIGDTRSGGMRLRFTIETKAGGVRTGIIAGIVIDEILMHIDAAKAALHGYRLLPDPKDIEDEDEDVEDEELVAEPSDRGLASHSMNSAAP